MISITLRSLEMLPQAWHSRVDPTRQGRQHRGAAKATDAGIGLAHVAAALMWLEQP
jgi:hypothetical protein